MKKLVLLAVCGMLLSLPSAFAQRIVVGVAPPPVVEEHPGRRPHPGWVWIPGYQRWNGRRYVWVRGRWMMPPRPRAVWIAGHWRQTRRGWVWVPGHWRG